MDEHSIAAAAFSFAIEHTLATKQEPRTKLYQFEHAARVSSGDFQPREDSDSIREAAAVAMAML